jgi:dipicolinate synthase subunit A
MLTGMKVAVFGGDARQIEIIHALTELNAKVYLFGFDKLANNFPGGFKENYEEFIPIGIDAIILPVPGTDELGKVESFFSNKETYLSDFFVNNTKPSSIIYSGIRTKFLDDISKRCGRKLVCLMERDDIAVYNSIPTAEGVIMLVIQNTDKTIHNSNVTILGHGRCGITLTRIFLALGANVKVGVRKPEQLARVFEMGAVPFSLEDIEKEIVNTEICINTIPHIVLTSKVIAKMPTQTYIIDIATKPGGTDFIYAEKRGIKALLAPGLPGIVAPKTAGRIIANVLCNLLIKQQSG